jgi:hypothetical protein
MQHLSPQGTLFVFLVPNCTCSYSILHLLLVSRLVLEHQNHIWWMCFTYVNFEPCVQDCCKVELVLSTKATDSSRCYLFLYLPWIHQPHLLSHCKLYPAIYKRMNSMTYRRRFPHLNCNQIGILLQSYIYIPLQSYISIALVIHQIHCHTLVIL